MRIVGRTVLVLALMASGCSIDFVGLDEKGATSITITSDHSSVAPDQRVRAIIEIERRGGGKVPTATVNGEPAASGHPRDDGVHELQWILSLDAATPVVNLSVDGSNWSVPLLTRAGEAICRLDGDLLLPVSLDRAGLPIGDRSWRLTLPDPSGPPAVWLEADGHLPEPLILQGSLLSPSRKSVQIRVTTESETGTPAHRVSLRLTTGADWSIPERCPQ